jgi:hypothetical protein
MASFLNTVRQFAGSIPGDQRTRRCSGTPSSHRALGSLPGLAQDRQPLSGQWQPSSARAPRPQGLEALARSVCRRGVTPIAERDLWGYEYQRASQAVEAYEDTNRRKFVVFVDWDGQLASPLSLLCV